MRGPKRKRTLESVSLVVDHDAKACGELGYCHSFVICLATALDAAGYAIEPAWLMGATGFAFRIWVHDRLLPHNMNTFDWNRILPQAVARAGVIPIYFQRGIDRLDREAEFRERAHDAIRHSIDRGIPAIAWDLNDPPMWGLIVGYNDHLETYDTLAIMDYRMPLPYVALGQRDVQILSVMILGNEREVNEAETLRQTLETALLHAEGKEGRSFAEMASGLAAYDLWAERMAPGALARHELQFAAYYAEMFYSFRYYAREYLRKHALGNAALERAVHAYGDVSKVLRGVHAALSGLCPLTDAQRVGIADDILLAKAHEIRGLQFVREFLETKR